jgi:hypothetical protein
MRHYGDVFPDRPFSEMAEPLPMVSSGFANRALWGVKVLVGGGALALLGWVMWEAYRLSPQLTILVMAMVAINMLIEFESG